MESAPRYSRQVCLPELGERGQTRLLAAEVVVPAGEGSEFCALYLERAGCRVVPSVRSEPPDAGAGAPLDAPSPVHDQTVFPHQTHFRFAEPRALGGGAWRALDEIRRILSAESP